MRVLRGRATESLDADRAATRELLDHTGETGEVGVRAWTPRRQVAFGRRDARTAGYGRAREAAASRAFPPIERSVGGRAVAYTGDTVAFARTEPVEGERTGIGERYARATTDLQIALHRLGIRAREGEPPHSFCPGSHSLQAGGGPADAALGGSDGDVPDAGGDWDDDGEPNNGSRGTGTNDGGAGKLVGLAQRVTGEAALVAGIVVTRDHGEIASVLDPVYDALGVPFDPGSVGSVARAGGNGDPGAVARAVEAVLVEGASRAVAGTSNAGDAEVREL